MKHLSSAGYARRIIQTHLGRLDLETGKAGLSPSDVEAVHQARVASRRLRSALWAFSCQFPPQKLKAWKEILRREARVLGSARDLDIQIAFLRSFLKGVREKGPRADAEKLLSFLCGKRTSQGPIIKRSSEEIMKSGVFASIRNAADKAAGSGRKRDGDKLYALAKNRISKRLTDLLAFEGYVFQPEKSLELHKMRIAAKKLRYTLENFAPLCGRRMERYIRASHRVQDLLGELHDLDVWLEVFPEFEKEIHGSRGGAPSKAYFWKKFTVLRLSAYRKFVSYWEKLERGREWKGLSSFMSSF